MLQQSRKLTSSKLNPRFINSSQDPATTEDFIEFCHRRQPNLTCHVYMWVLSHFWWTTSPPGISSSFSTRSKVIVHDKIASRLDYCNKDSDINKTERRSKSHEFCTEAGINARLFVRELSRRDCIYADSSWCSIGFTDSHLKDSVSRLNVLVFHCIHHVCPDVSNSDHVIDPLDIAPLVLWNRRGRSKWRGCYTANFHEAICASQEI